MPLLILQKKYTRNLIATDERNFALMLLCWNPQRGSPIHSHAGSECLLRVLRGQLLESSYTFPSTACALSTTNAPAIQITDIQPSEADVDDDQKLEHGFSKNVAPSSLHIGETSFLTLSENILNQGVVTHINDTIGVHKIENVFDAEAITLHLYMPPFESCVCWCERTGKALNSCVTFYSENGEIAE